MIKEGLIARLRKATAPICVAVGAAHLSMNIEKSTSQSLVQILRTAGFLVEQV